MQSSVSVSMWFMWIITGLSESYKVLHKISNKELQSKEKFHFETVIRNQSESFSLIYSVSLASPLWLQPIFFNFIPHCTHFFHQEFDSHYLTCTKGQILTSQSKQTFTKVKRLQVIKYFTYSRPELGLEKKW